MYRKCCFYISKQPSVSNGRKNVRRHLLLQWKRLLGNTVGVLDNLSLGLTTGSDSSRLELWLESVSGGLSSNLQVLVETGEKCVLVKVPDNRTPAKCFEGDKRPRSKLGMCGNSIERFNDANSSQKMTIIGLLISKITYEKPAFLQEDIFDEF